VDRDPAAAPKAAQVAAVAAVAERLGNTFAVCRKCYIHPDVLAAFEDPVLRARWDEAARRARRRTGLAADEVKLLRFLDAAR
jgi:DNA topoisomerase-1